MLASLLAALYTWEMPAPAPRIHQDAMHDPDPAPAEAIRVGFATPEYFEGLGVRPLYGRTFGDGDRDATGAVLSYGFWHRRFNGDVQALGRPMCGYPSPR